MEVEYVVKKSIVVEDKAGIITLVVRPNGWGGLK